MHLKLVIATHPNYQDWLSHFLTSLNYKDHLEDIIVCVADVPTSQHNYISTLYRTKYQLRYILTSSKNIDEYTAFVSLGTALKTGSIGLTDATHFLMLHDTMKAGATFWKDIERIKKTIEPPPETQQSPTHQHIEIIEHSPTVYKLTIPLQYMPPHTQLIAKFIKVHSGQTINMDHFIYEQETRRFIAVDSNTYHPIHPPLYIENMLDKRLTKDPSKAQRFSFTHEILTYSEPITPKDQSNMLLWFPFADNFNCGVATRGFIVNTLYPAFDKAPQFSKHEAIDIELNQANPLNLRTLAGSNRWRYLFGPANKTIKFTNTKNDIDVIGNGKLRSVAEFECIDLQKYLYFMRNKTDRHDSGRD